MPAFAGGGNNADSLAAASGPNAPGVNVRRLPISVAEINPNYKKVSRWNTSSLNMYQVNMTRFMDTLSYSFDEQGMKYTVPHGGRVTSGFGPRNLFGRHFHKGLDIDLETGEPVVAALPGVVRIASAAHRGYGNCVVIAHEGGLETLYGHLSQLDVVEGQIVQSGQKIGLGGSTGQSTGPHLHFELRVFGEQVDPLKVFDALTMQPKSKDFKVDPSWFDHLLTDHDHFHVVAAGQTLDEISAMYELDKEFLCQINHLKADASLPEGTRLLLDEH
jgi:murein DD-endopeptidase MepM/ murein hydrolase activator NlpD